MTKSVVVGIAGGTGGGKTTFAQGVARRLGSKAVIIAHDNYYRANHDVPFEERVHLNYDHPHAYETDLLVEHLDRLRAGECVRMPQYDFARHDRAERTVVVRPAPVIIVEGIMVLAERELRERMDMRVFVDLDADERILRRLRRDVEERGRSVGNVIEQYLTTVRPMHEEFVEPSKRHADVIVPAWERNDRAQELLVGWLERRVG